MQVKRMGISFIIGFCMAIVGTSGWFLFFGYQTKFSLLENVQLALSITSFWIAVLIWTFLYTFAVALPLLSLTSKKKS